MATSPNENVGSAKSGQKHSEPASPTPAEERLRDNLKDPEPWRPADAPEKKLESTKSAAAGGSNTENQTGDPGRTPGSAEGEDFEETGNE